MSEIKGCIEDLFVSFFDATTDFASSKINGDDYEKRLSLIATKSEAYSKENDVKELCELTKFTDATISFYKTFGEEASRICANMLCECFVGNSEGFDELSADLEVKLLLQSLDIKQEKKGG